MKDQSNEEPKKIIALELTEEEYAALKKEAERNKIPTKTLSKFIIQNTIRESKRSKAANFFDRFFPKL
jgi:hypothetical protein